MLITRRVYLIVVLLFISLLESMGCQRSIVLTVDLPISLQLSRENTVYRVNKDFDLKGAEVVIPKNSTLRFEGGCIKNGVVFGQNTLLDGNIKCYTGIKGSFKNKFVEIGWFLNGANDISDILQQITNTNINEIVISGGIWMVSKTTDLRGNLMISGKDNPIIEIDRSVVTGPFSVFRISGTVLSFEPVYNYSNITIKDITFDENGSNVQGRTTVLYICNAENVKIQGCKFLEHESDKYASYVWAALTLYNCRNCTVQGCYTNYVRLANFGFCVNCTALNNEGYNTPGTWLESCDGYGIVYKYNEIYENLFFGNSTISQNSKNGIIKNNTIVVNGKEVDSMINIGHPSNDTYLNSGDGCIVENNVVKTETSKGIIVWGSSQSKDVVIRNNDIYSKSKHAIFVSDAIPSITIKNNRIVGHDEDQVLVLVGAEESRIQRNTITTIGSNIHYTPIRVRRNDNQGRTVIRRNTIDNGNNLDKESFIDLDLKECNFEDNKVRGNISTRSIRR